MTPLCASFWKLNLFVQPLSTLLVYSLGWNVSKICKANSKQIALSSAQEKSTYCNVKKNCPPGNTKNDDVCCWVHKYFSVCFCYLWPAIQSNYYLKTYFSFSGEKNNMLQLFCRNVILQVSHSWRCTGIWTWIIPWIVPDYSLDSSGLFLG